MGRGEMLKQVRLAALAAALATPALAQAAKLADRPLRRIKDFDQAAIRQGLTALGKA